MGIFALERKLRMSQGTFTKVTRSDRRLYGPRSILVSGYPVHDQQVLLDMLTSLGLADISVKFITDDLAEERLGRIAARPAAIGLGMSSTLARAVIMAGITEKELHQIMTGYRALGLTAQLWATLTPTSETWPVSVLLQELEAEKAAFEKRSSSSERST
jgi:hypothetical protein